MRRVAHTLLFAQSAGWVRAGPRERQPNVLPSLSREGGTQQRSRCQQHRSRQAVGSGRSRRRARWGRAGSGRIGGAVIGGGDAQLGQLLVCQGDVGLIVHRHVDAASQPRVAQVIAQDAWKDRVPGRVGKAEIGRKRGPQLAKACRVCRRRPWRGLPHQRWPGWGQMPCGPPRRCRGGPQAEERTEWAKPNGMPDRGQVVGSGAEAGWPDGAAS